MYPDNHLYLFKSTWDLLLKHQEDNICVLQKQLKVPFFRQHNLANDINTANEGNAGDSTTSWSLSKKRLYAIYGMQVNYPCWGKVSYELFMGMSKITNFSLEWGWGFLHCIVIGGTMCYCEIGFCQIITETISWQFMNFDVSFLMVWTFSEVYTHTHTNSHFSNNPPAENPSDKTNLTIEVSWQRSSESM